MVVFATDWRACGNPDTVCLAQRRHRASVHGFTVAAVYDVFYWISAWHFLYRLACSFFSLTSKQDAGKYEVTDIYQGEGTHALTRKLGLIYSCNVQKRLRQFDQIAPWIAEKREPQCETGRVPRFADNPHITTFKFTDRGIDILDAQPGPAINSMRKLSSEAGARKASVFSPSAIVRIKRKSSVPVYQAAAASKSGTRSPTWSPRHEVKGLVGLVDVASLDAGMGFFQKGGKHISQKNGTLVRSLQRSLDAWIRRLSSGRIPRKRV
jgi:hypothetical protein